MKKSNADIELIDPLLADTPEEREVIDLSSIAKEEDTSETPVFEIPTMEAKIAENIEAKKQAEKAENEVSDTEPEPAPAIDREENMQFGANISSFISDFVLNGLPTMLHDQVAIDTKKLVEWKEEGILDDELFKEISEKNDENEQAFQIPDFIKNEWEKGIKETLQKKSLEVHISPEKRLFAASAMLIGFLGYQTYEVKKSNDKIIQTIEAKLGAYVPKTKKRRRK